MGQSVIKVEGIFCIGWDSIYRYKNRERRESNERRGNGNEQDIYIYIYNTTEAYQVLFFSRSPFLYHPWYGGPLTPLLCQ